MRKAKWFFTFLLVISLSVLMAGLYGKRNTQQQEIAEINTRIKAHNMNWVAGETSMTRLSPEERRKRLGNINPLYIDPSKFAAISTDISIQALVDWRNKDSSDWMTPIRDQGTCGSCWCFGTLAVVESVWKITQNKPTSNPDLSEQHLLSCSGAGDCIVGGSYYQACGYIKNSGVPNEACFPYTAADDPCNPCTDYLQKLARINGYAYVTQGGYLINQDIGITSNTAIMNELNSHPLIGSMEVYSDFYSYTGGVYEKTPGATSEGGHCIALIGYDSVNQYWICKNSWGTDWGEDGYFKIKFDEVDVGKWVMKVWGVTLANKPPVLSAVSDQNVKEGVELKFQLQATDPDNDTITYSAVSMPTGATLASDTGEFIWTPTYTQSGTYYVQFTATDGIFSDTKTGKIIVVNVKKGKGKF
ncbi:MAG: putative Ig domain-containing protein [Candidatus Aminicenantes bacterium]|nr:putative Ig domain-containing protein [Candidatus Aminicenantes bacterium]